MGLYSIIENSESDKPYFSTFCKKYGFLHSGIFSLKENLFYLSHSFGLDSETIIRSVSTKAFWNGTIEMNEKKWISLYRKNNQLKDFFQFMSSDLRDNVEQINLFCPDIRSDDFFFDICFNEKKLLPSDETFLRDMKHSIFPDTYFKENSIRNFIKNNPTDELDSFPSEIKYNLYKTLYENSLH